MRRELVDQRERIDGFDADGRLVDVHRWDPRDHPNADPASVRAVVIGDMAANSGVVQAQVLMANGKKFDVRRQAVTKCRELHDGEV